MLSSSLLLLECENRAAVRRGRDAHQFPSLRVHLIGFVLDELGALRRVLGESDNQCLIHFSSTFLFLGWLYCNAGRLRKG